MGILFSFAAMVLCMFRFNPLTAAAANDDIVYDPNGGELYVTCTVLDADAINAMKANIASQLQVGDVQVTVNFKDNPGYASSGYGVVFDPNYTIIPDPNNPQSALHIRGDAGDDLTINATLAADKNMIGFGSMGTDNEYDDGAIVSVFVRPLNSNAPVNPVTKLDIDMISNLAQVRFLTVANATTEVRVTTALCGDLDGNGIVNNDDTTLMNLALKNVTVTVTESNYKRYFATYNGVTIFEVVDVDANGIVNEEDAVCLLRYYTQVYVIKEEPHDVGNAGQIVAHVGNYPIEAQSATR